jgi:thiamine-monophosphate kinase
MSDPPERVTHDEFGWIAALRPLTRGAPAALGLMDDAAVLPSRPGFDLVISEDAMVEGVHFLVGERADLVARRLLRTSLSDLAAKAAEPFGYTMTAAWPASRSWDERMAFIRGLDEDGQRYSVVLMGGDTVATPGPLTLSATVFGWVPAGAMVRRAGAQPGHALVVCGVIGDGYLGLKAARGEPLEGGEALAASYRLPEPRFELREALRSHAAAAADVSDGLIADALHIAEASGCGLVLDLSRMPLSPAAQTWIRGQTDPTAALLQLASGGDDYALVCAAGDGEALVRAAEGQGVQAAVVGCFVAGSGAEVRMDDQVLTPHRLGWRHA